MTTPLREATNRRIIRGTKTTPSTAPRRVHDPSTTRKTLTEKENVMEVPVKPLFTSPYLLREVSEADAPTLTVVLDLDETLVSNRRLDLPAAILRPYVLDALMALRQLSNVEVVLWTASTEETAAPVVRQLSARGRVFDDVIFRNDMWFTEPYHTKDLRLLGRSMDRVVIFDNAANCCKINKCNAVLVDDFTGYFNPADNTLINMFRVVEVLARDIEQGSTVQASLKDLAHEDVICRNVTYELPEAWRRVCIDDIDPLQVPPHGSFLKVSVTEF